MFLKLAVLLNLRTVPKHSVGNLVKYISEQQNYPGGYLLINSRRWVCPTGQGHKQWVYDGAMLRAVNGGSIETFTHAACVVEENLAYRPVNW